MSNSLPTAFSQHLFWDVDRNSLDVEQHKMFIVQRVLGYGMVSDWKLIKQLYGEDGIKQVVLTSRYLDKKTLGFCSAYFNEPLTKFRCYTHELSSQAHWPY